MTTRIVLAVVCFYFFQISIVGAQFDIGVFPLDSFKLPLIDRHALELQGGFGSQHNSYDYYETNHFSRNTNISTHASANYSHYLNTIGRQSYSSVQLSPRFSSSSGHYEDPTDNTKGHNLYSYLSSIGYSRKYSGNRFLELNHTTSLSYNDVFVDGQNLSIYQDHDRQQTHASLGLGIGIGHGRIEPVSDMALALFLLEDAVELGIDPNQIQQSDVEDFAQLMAQVQNERVFDSRKKIISELRQLYDFMLSKNWVLHDDPGFFTVLTDNWLYSYYPYRNAGTRWTYSLNPNYDLDIDHNLISNNTKTRITESQYGISLTADFIKAKPIDVHNDVVRSHEFAVGVFQLDEKQDNIKNQSSYGQAGMYHSLGRYWYPSTRTHISAIASLEYNYYRNLKVMEDEQHEGILGVSGTVDYYVSSKTRFTIQALLSYRYDSNSLFSFGANPFEGTSTWTFRGSLNAGIGVNLF